MKALDNDTSVYRPKNPKQTHALMPAAHYAIRRAIFRDNTATFDKKADPDKLFPLLVAEYRGDIAECRAPNGIVCGRLKNRARVSM